MIGSEDGSSVYIPPTAFRQQAHISSFDDYQRLYKLSIADPNSFWSQLADQFYWHERPPLNLNNPPKILKYNFDYRKGDVCVKWFEGWKTNICYNVLDRNVEDGFGDRVAYIWEGNEPSMQRKITYAQLLKEVCKFANVLKSRGVTKGSRVAVYMPMTIEQVSAQLL